MSHTHFLLIPVLPFPFYSDPFPPDDYLRRKHVHDFTIVLNINNINTGSSLNNGAVSVVYTKMVGTILDVVFSDSLQLKRLFRPTLDSIPISFKGWDK